MDEDVSVSEVKGKKIKDFPFMLLLFFLLFALGAGGTYYLAKTKPGLIGLPKNAAENQAEVDALVAQVGKLIALSTDEKPTVATVTDADKLKDQPFFKNAKNGDKVLVYQNAKRAILYRPSENLIVDVGSVNINNELQATTTSSPSPTPKATINPTPSLIPTPTPQQ